MSKFKAGQTYKTRNGSIARIYATDGGKNQEIQGAVNSDEDGWDAMTWNKQGRYITDQDDSAWDLMPHVEIWYLVIYLDPRLNKVCSLVFHTDAARQIWINFQPDKSKILATFEKEKP